MQILRTLRQRFQQLVPGTAGQPHEIITQAGHFLQEDKGEEIARKLISFLKNIH